MPGGSTDTLAADGLNLKGWGFVDMRVSIDVAKLDWATLRVGQWKVDLNRERVDSSGRQQFVDPGGNGEARLGGQFHS